MAENADLKTGVKTGPPSGGGSRPGTPPLTGETGFGAIFSMFNLPYRLWYDSSSNAAAPAPRRSQVGRLRGTCSHAEHSQLMSQCTTGLGRKGSGQLAGRALARQASDGSTADYTAKLEDQVDLLMEEVSGLLSKVGFSAHRLRGLLSCSSPIAVMSRGHRQSGGSCCLICLWRRSPASSPR